MAREIVMYESNWCGFCFAARRLFKKKGWDYTSIVVDGNPELRAEMEQRSGRHTVPQVFIGGEPVGGFTDIAALDAEGELDERVLGDEASS